MEFKKNRDYNKLNSENKINYVFYFDTFEQAIQGSQKETYSDIISIKLNNIKYILIRILWK